MRWRRVILLLTIAVARGGEPPANDPAARPIDPAHFDATLLTQEISKATNAARRQNGLRPLISLEPLDAAADDQAAVMATMFFCGHDNPLPGQRTPYLRVERRGLHPQSVGENAIMVPVCAEGSGRPLTYHELAQGLITRWLNSPEHRANLLKESFRNLGCAARVGPALISHQPMVYATQVFCVQQ